MTERLVYAHTVIECTITATRQRMVTLAELSIPSDTPGKQVGIVVAELSDVIALRGYGLPTEVKIDADTSPAAIAGSRLILCCYWVPTLNMFSVPARFAMFRREGDRWVDVRPAVGAEPASMSHSDMSSLIEYYSLSAITRRADLVLVGHVRAVVDTTIVSGERFQGQRVDLVIDESIKGDRHRGVVSFILAKGRARPSWYTQPPRAINQGESWMVFLRRDGSAYYPVAGINGLLQLDGQSVLYDRVVTCPVSRSTLVAKVREAANETR